MKRYFILPILLIMFALSAQSQVLPKERGLATITQESVLSPVRFLASDWLEGREIGTRGGQIAGEYLASMFGTIGLLPNGDAVVFNPDSHQKLLGAKSELKTTFFQSFQTKSISQTDHNTFSIISNENSSAIENKFTYKADFKTNGTLSNVSIKAPVVFVGYGLADSKKGYDDFSAVDVRNKIIVRLKGLPGEGFPNSEAFRKIKQSDYENVDELKNELAKSKGALAIVEIDDNLIAKETFSNNNLLPQTSETEGKSKYFDKRVLLTSEPTQNITTFSVVQNIADELFPNGKNILSLKNIASEMKNISFEIPNKEISLSTEVQTDLVGARNVIGQIDGRQKDKYIVIGAHYDHLGFYGGKIWNGADDNASGVSAVLNIAKAMVTSGVQPEYTILFACWDGEERGLLGSRYFLNTFSNPENILCYLNFDMIGRDAGPDVPQNKVAMIYTETFKSVAELTKKQVKAYNLDLDINYSATEKPESGSDNSWFARKNIPLFWFHTGAHPDYHQPSDHVELINSKKMEAIIKLSYLNIFDFATGPKIIEK